VTGSTFFRKQKKTILFRKRKLPYWVSFWLYDPPRFPHVFDGHLLGTSAMRK